ncbi:unnamed protein product [Tilletia laevis]|nr:hypothetical protein CF335_g6920 [Tilletia laevis]KAE8263705.1 hypothetical protein A4X03_0g1491 [Tilletia caries]CAD6910247.1 unnamed protein product [Tilletia controversa]CAD6893770.1 unnamed protein product [Tilletia caries]CAD6899126.1 unnamed protein product [Tilletia laevis]
MASAADSSAGNAHADGLAAVEDSNSNGATGAGAGAIAGPSSEPLLLPGDSPPAYQYSQEISQMMFVFGDIEDPPDDVLKLIEDIVRTQVVEMIIQSRRISQRRASRTLSPEDLIFLIRYDRAKVNRLRIYLSWREVRKKAKESDDVGGGAAGDADLEDAGAMDAATKTRKLNVKLPWELSTIFSEHLRPSAGDDADEEDEDDIEAHEDSLTRLKEADEATRMMTREEYVHYSECRQASFSYRKSKKFRDFINAPAYLDGNKPSDDIIDILGFLAFEVVRELCEGALEVHRELEETARMMAERRKALAAEVAKGRDRALDPVQPVSQRDAVVKGGSPITKGTRASASSGGEATTMPSTILKVTDTTDRASAGDLSTSAEENGVKQDSTVDRPRKRARFTEPAVTTTQSGPFASSSSPTAIAANFDRGTPLSSSRAYDSIELPQLSSLLLPRPGVPADPNDATTFCALFAPAPGSGYFLDGVPSSTTTSLSPSPAMLSTPQFGGHTLSQSREDKAAGEKEKEKKRGVGDGKEAGDEPDGNPSDGDDDADDTERGGKEKPKAGSTEDAHSGATANKTTSDAQSSEGTEKAAATAAATAANATAESTSRRPKPVPPQLAISHIYEAFARLQRRRTALAGSARTSGTGGLRRTRMFVI